MKFKCKIQIFSENEDYKILLITINCDVCHVIGGE